MIEIKRRPQAASSPRKSFAGAYHAIYRAIAEYHEQHYPPRLTDEYWQSAIEGIKALSIRFEGEAYAKALIHAVFAELEAEYKRVRDAEPGEQQAAV